MWVENVPTDNLDRLAEIVGGAGVDPVAFFAGSQDPANKARLKNQSDEAVARGAFGAPTFFVGERMWWGHDRMDQLAYCLAHDLP
jgi:2-hydroxychromene-2-carboxylate isomerase